MKDPYANIFANPTAPKTNPHENVDDRDTSSLYDVNLIHFDLTPHLYTTYFSKIKKLPRDVVPVSIARFPPKGVKILEYKTLAPSTELLMSYKQTGDWAAYVNTYNQTVLAKLDPYETVENLKALTNSANIALVCFEKDFTHCHRTLVAEWMKAHGFDVQEYN